MLAAQEPLKRPLTLEEAFARAVAYNLDERVKVLEKMVAQRDFEFSKLDLLPKVGVNAGYSNRDNILASSSTSILTNRQSLEPSTSTDRDLRFADLTGSWNILDFWVSYFNARQQADRVLVAEEQRRRVLQGLFQDVRRAFWRAASAQRLGDDIRDSIRVAQRALTSSRKVENEALRSPIDALRYQKSLLDALRDLESVQRQLDVSKIELAALLNLPPGTNYSVVVPNTLRVARLGVPVKQMEEVALLRNPDVREASYQVRISADETRKMLARNLPGLNFSYGPSFDSNSFVVNNSWTAGAVRLSGNLVSILSIPEQMRRGELMEQTAVTRRQALSMAVLAKLHIAYQQYLSATKEYYWADQLASIDRRLYQQISNRTETDAQSELERVSARVSAVNSDLRRYRSYAEAQAALGRLYDVVGIDPVPEKVPALDIASLSAAIRKTSSDWKNGRLADAVAAEPAGAAPVAAVASHSPRRGPGAKAVAEPVLQ
ncbi:TolC family protein [Bosea sp. 685]|uniref:TolC family protein n=1 Tax=Bosea sp. 685 TaxID=3080057 RepID=UPI002893796B|nr:TolC family protein [Bosea sp. 685]WNJ91575.1 TolC family protein [Bosea sp. 685]